MRIWALAAFMLFLANQPAIAASDASTVQNKDANQKIENKNGNMPESVRIFSHNDNFLEAEYAPLPKRSLPSKINQLPRDYSKKITSGTFFINASAYTAAADECGKSDGITASGKKVMEGRTLACPPQFKFGTRIKIDQMGEYVCEDRGGAIKGNHFDIYMETKKDAFAFGRKILFASVVE